MSNRLYKSVATTYVPGSPGISSDPGQPYQPDGYYWETQTVCRWREVTTLTGQTSGAVSVTEWVYSCEKESIRVYRDEQPYEPPTAPTAPTASQFITDYQLGWNAGARSIAAIPGNGTASFVVPHSNSGAFVGLNDADLSPGYTELNYAVYAHRGIAEVYENGEMKYYVGPYAEGAVFKIRRRNGVVSYLVNDVVVYTSATPSSAVLFMDASIYTGGEYIDNPTLVEEFGGYAAMSFAPLDLFAVGRVSTDPAYSSSSAEMSMQPMQVSARTGPRVAMSFEPMTMLAANKPYGEARMSMRPMTLVAEGGLLKPAYGLASLSMVPMGVYATGLTGGVGSAAMSFLPMDMLAANKVYGEAHLSMLPPAMRAYTYADSTEAQAMSRALVVDSVQVQGEFSVVATSFGTAASLYLVETFADVTTLSVATAVTPTELQQVLSVSAYSLGAGNTLLPLEDQAPQVWVVNTENLGSTRYENYGFNSFAKIDGRYYGAKSDGVYRLEGAADGPTPVQAMVSFGKHGFGTAQLKMVTNAYLGASSTGQLFMKVVVEGQEYLYAARASSEELKVQRVDLGRGLRANYLEFELYNADGDDFELADVEFVVVPLNRRI